MDGVFNKWHCKNWITTYRKRKFEPYLTNQPQIDYRLNHKILNHKTTRRKYKGKDL